MSAVSGILALDGGPVEPDRVDRIAQPPPGSVLDALETWSEGPVGLACALNRISPESAPERQPRWDAESGVVVLLDGRLDNRRELRNLVGSPPAADAPDVDYVLAAYLRWGTELVLRLLGDYALAVWDGREDGRLLLACDPMGARPLYHAVEDGRLLFASTLEQILAALDRRPGVDDAMALTYVYRPLLSWPGSSFLAGVEALPGGELLEARGGAVTIRRFHAWRDRPPDRYEARGDEAEEFRALLFDAVDVRLRSAPPVGLYLSGGLDSGAVGSIAGTLRRADPAHVRSYTCVFDRFSGADEREYAVAVTRRFDLPHTLVSCDESWTLVDLEPVLAVMTEPYCGPFDALNHRALPVVRGDGPRALLTGHLGDVLLLRTATYFSWWLAAGRWRALAEQVSRKRATGRFGFGYQLAAWGVFPLLPAPLQRAVHRRRLRGLWLLEGWMPPDVRRRAAEESRELVHSGRQGWWQELRNDVVVSVATPQGRYLDRLYRSYGLEPRHPFFDRRIAEFVLRTPPDVFFRDGRSRWVLTEALGDVLPPLVRDRTDKSASAGLMRYGLRERRAGFVRQLLRDSELVRRGYVLAEPWRASVERYLGGSDEEPIWGGLSTEIWLRHGEGRLPDLERG